MGNFSAIYFRERDGTEPVLEFLRGQSPKTRVAIRNQIDRLNLLHDGFPHLPFPHSSQVAGELRELRCHYGSQHYRVLYARSERLIVLLHAFPKNAGQIPETEMEIARERFRDFKRRMNSKPRRPPRPIGRDAP